MEASDEDYGARVRAAIAYGKLLDPEAAKIMGFGIKTLERVEKNVRELTIPEAKALALATSVPLEFLTDGWGHVGAKLNRLEQTINSLEAAQVQTGATLLEVIARLDAMQPPEAGAQ